MDKRRHPLFEKYPLKGQRETSVGHLPTPYHIYDGHGLFIGGTADLAKISQLLQNEKLYPMQTRSGRAMMGIWVVDFTDSSLGPHNELQFSMLVSHQPSQPIEDHPLTLLKALFMNPDARMFCYGLWNDTEAAVVYNQELLGLDARLNQGSIKREKGRKTFQFSDETGKLLFEGQVNEAKKASLRVGLSLLRLLGWRQTVRASRQPVIAAKVVNPISEAWPANMDAQSFLAADSTIVQFFDPAADQIAFGAADTGRFDFLPDFVEHFTPFRFVYLEPERIT